MSARDVIVWTIKSLGAFDPTRETDAVLVALHAAGYRLLGPGEIDVETVERIASSPLSPKVIAAAWGAWHSRHGGKLGPGPAFSEAITAAIRALKTEGRDA